MLLFLVTACADEPGHDDHLKALEKEWKKHIQPKDSIVNVMQIGKTFALESSETQGIDHERFKAFDYWKEYDENFFEKQDSKDFSNPEEAGGVKYALEIFKAIKKGETEIRFYKKHYYGNRDPKDTSYVKDTITYLYNIYKFKVE
jgi:hypothetical protein